jgi:hypothetical protein
MNIMVYLEQTLLHQSNCWWIRNQKKNSPIVGAGFNLFSIGFLRFLWLIYLYHKSLKLTRPVRLS